MTVNPLFVELIVFHANTRCMDDPELFKEVRDMAARTTTVNAMYWGRSVQSPSTFVWLLFCDSFEQCVMKEGTPSYNAELVNRLDALVEDPFKKTVFHIRFSDSPLLTCIESPLTVFAIPVLDDIQRLDTWKSLLNSMMADIRAMGLGGYFGSAYASPLEDVKSMAYFSGWESVEVHMKVGDSEDENHRNFRRHCEEFFLCNKHLQVHYVFFERHVDNGPTS